jgi:hypothetical protein
MSFVFFEAGNRKKWSIPGDSIQKHHQPGVKVIFVLFRQRFAFRSVSPESRNTVVFYPQKSCAVSKTYVSSSIYGVVPHGLAQGRTATGEKLSSGGISG